MRKEATVAQFHNTDLEEVNETTKNLSQDTQSLSWELNPRPPKHSKNANHLNTMFSSKKGAWTILVCTPPTIHLCSTFTLKLYILHAF
jgi:hypothetical protein